jgi:preprotein translocase subunit SecF
MWRLNLYNTNIDFLYWRKLAMAWSIAVLLIAIGSLLIRGMNLGLDFTGGTVIEVQYPESVEIPMVRETLAKTGFGDAQTQHFGTSKDVLIRIPPHDQRNAATLSNEVLHALQRPRAARAPRWRGPSSSGRRWARSWWNKAGWRRWARCWES